ncbi:ABC transporter substrate-binding protein [Clostridium sartagoforme AAU1]|jgi:putative tryptophan/tyrosine transport system substrate-binding protein|uniref:ABC transporter substrate-binding protein n=1 Tax=Clostridium sartagoforme AAU1 TaxID=1202534 RepID=R9CDK8_9CLOT|nr:ABC transporter substrate-binding protein [Clostridium sartagoforme]EOR27362.1 ABC transporter substrate-binding protein [Clostridium sartagoforme AAU1]
MVGKKKISLILISLLTVSNLLGCEKTKDSASVNEETKIRIGVNQLVQHPALDSAREGFIEGLKEKGYEDNKNISIDYQNAQGDTATSQTIAQKFVADKKDLILAIATPAAQAVYNATKDIPTVFTAVTDPIAAEIAKDWRSSGTNLTGVSDMVPVDKQLELLLKLKPDVKTIGVIYNTSEANSEVQVEALKKEAEKVNLKVKEIGITNVNEINQNLTSAIKDIDALYTPTDNTVASAYDLVGQIAIKNNIPILGAEEAVVSKGGLCSIGIDYFKLGKETAYKAVEILEGKKPNEIEITTLSDMNITINTDVATKLNIEIPSDLDEKSNKVTGGVN